MAPPPPPPPGCSLQQNNLILLSMNCEKADRDIPVKKRKRKMYGVMAMK